MGFIRQVSQTVSGGSVRYVFEVSEELRRYFTGEPLQIEYDFDVGDVPPSVLSVAFVANFLPFAWFFDAEIDVEELDEDFYNCLPSVRSGYEPMYPEWKMGGRVCFANLVKNDSPSRGRSAVFFSGGLDAVQTLLAHLDEKPDLLSIWGADVASSNAEGWSVTHAKILDVAKKLGLPNHVVRNNFRQIEKEGLLHNLVMPVLGDGWWHGIKHSVPMLGMSAPIAYKHGYSCCYIASSHCKSMGMVKCASNPWVDNMVRFCGCQIVHDGYEYDRQGKADFVVEEAKRRHLIIPLRVCWETQAGGNCCHCEKCFRTITEILVAGGDPEEFGFTNYREHYNYKSVVSMMRRTFYEGHEIGRKDIILIWNASVPRIKSRKAQLRGSLHWKIFKWMLKHDFTNRKDISLPFGDRIAPYKAQVRRFVESVKIRFRG